MGLGSATNRRMGPGALPRAIVSLRVVALLERNTA